MFRYNAEKVLKFSKFILPAILLIIGLASCGKDNSAGKPPESKPEFAWKSEVKITDIPDIPLKGMMNGQPFTPDYVNFEQWRGSGDHVINFCENAPKNNCGFVESGRSVHFMHKAGKLDSGEVLKASFDKNLDGYIAYSDSTAGGQENASSSVPWNCALVITSMDDKIVRGRIIICFKDPGKSYLAGTFEAKRCYN